MFIFIILRQAWERKLDLRSFVLPMVAVFWIAQMYVYSIPTAGNDLVLVATLASP